MSLQGCVFTEDCQGHFSGLLLLGTSSKLLRLLLCLRQDPEKHADLVEITMLQMCYLANEMQLAFVTITV